MCRWSIVILLVAAATASAQTPDGARAAPVLTEFRAFAGEVEVTSGTRFRVVRSDRRDGSEPIDAERSLTPLSPGIYDVQALRADRGVIAVKSLERVTIAHYPDQGDRHLEVINFTQGYGALQLRAASGELDPRQVTVFESGTRSRPVGRPMTGDGYLLYVVPAGLYDVRIAHDEHGGAADAHWVLAITVGADRTRLKLIDAALD